MLTITYFELESSQHYHPSYLTGISKIQEGIHQDYDFDLHQQVSDTVNLLSYFIKPYCCHRLVSCLDQTCLTFFSIVSVSSLPILFWPWL